MADETQNPAGWYSDPQNPNQPRYWDGVAWAPAGASTPPGSEYAVEQQSTSGFAIASLVSGILWIFGIGSILAVVFGFIARQQIAASNGSERGSGMATAGIVLGFLGIALIIGFFILVYVQAIVTLDSL